MSIQTLEKEFLDFCARISPGELERNPEIKNDIAALRWMIAQLRGRLQLRAKSREKFGKDRMKTGSG